ncbi:MAG TPA: hypothetical protein VF522_23575 [Ramlibacter sp.]|uniref:hypothetical protein n=1 Tax=Ramlibacter sp. TaxID=1917967 RepID=UPI002ED50887
MRLPAGAKLFSVCLVFAAVVPDAQAEIVHMPVLKCIQTVSGQRQPGSSNQPVTVINQCGMTINYTWDANGEGHAYGHGSNLYARSIPAGGRDTFTFDLRRAPRGVPIWACPQNQQGSTVHFNTDKRSCSYLKR